MDIKIKNGKEYIFDIVRRKYIRNQPEEWVRQNIIQYLHEEKGYPISLMGIEKKNEINNIKKRCDIVCYDTKGQPLLLVECKSQNSKLKAETFNQTISYQRTLKAKYLLITNGQEHFCFHITRKKLIFLNQIPSYQKIK